METKKPARKLTGPGRVFWNKVLKQYAFESEHDFELLYQGCSTLNEIVEAEKVVSKEGRFIRDRFEQIREHPAMKTIRDNKLLFMKLVRELGLTITDDQARSPRQY